MLLFSQNQLPEDISWDRVKLLSIHSQYFSDLGAQVAKDFWYHVSLYTGQALTSHVKGFQKQQRMTAIFVENYLIELESILGKQNFLSENSLTILKLLKDEVKKEDFKVESMSERSPLRNALAFIVKDVFENVMKGKALNIEMKTDNQVEFSKAFSKPVQNERVVYFDNESYERFHFSSKKISWYTTSICGQMNGLVMLNNTPTTDFEFVNFQNRIVMKDKLSGKLIGFTVDPIENKVQINQCVNLYF